MKKRLENHYEASTSLSLMSDKDLLRLLRKSPQQDGWGANQVIELPDGRRVFVKRIPLTDLEKENAYSTRNHYRIPTYYNYGVGSAGFGAFRELAAHVKTTNWVLNGEHRSFPLLHHHRVLPESRAPVTRAERSRLKEYVSYWNSSRPVENYMMDRRRAKQMLVLFLEWIPYEFSQWISDNPQRLEPMFRRAIKTVNFMFSKKLIHFDAHVFNWVTDGKELYLADFGLALDEDFQLTKDERSFFSRHRYYDYAQVTSLIGDSVLDAYIKLGDEDRKRIDDALGESPKDFHPFYRAITKESLGLHEKGLLKLTSAQRRLIEHYKPVLETTREFFFELRNSRRKNTRYPYRKLKRQLREAGLVR